MRKIAHILDAVIQLRDNFSSTLATVEKGIGGFSRTAQNMGKDVKKVGKNLENTGGNLTKGLTLPIIGIGVAAAKVGMDFEASMSQVKAMSGATGEEMGRLEKAARDAGSATSKSAKDAADGLTYMALAGWDVDKSISGLMPVLRLSEAGNIDLARASSLVTDSMSAMGIKVEDLEGYLDVVAQTARSSNTDIDQMAEAYLGVGGTLRGLNVPLEESALALGMLANAGVKGSEAGTGLNAILLNMTAPTGRAKKALKDLGLTAFDNAGNFKGLENVLFELKDKTKDMTEEQRNMMMSMIGGKEHVTSLNALMNGLDDTYVGLKGSIADADGALDEIASTMMDNNKGSITSLMSGIEEVGLKIYDVLKPAIADVTDILQGFTKKINALTPEQQEMIVKFAMMAATIGPAVLIIGKLTSRVGRAMTTFGKFAGVVKKVGLIKAIFNPGVLVVGAIVAMIAVGVLLYKNWDKIKDATNKVKDQFNKVKDTIAVLKDNFIDFKDNAIEKTREKFNDFKQMLKDNEEAIIITAGILGTVFGPALVIAGGKAVVAGAQIVISFIGSIIASGTQSIATGAIILAEFVGNMILAGGQAIITGVQIIASFVWALITTAAQAVITGATITVNLIGSLINYAAQGWITVGSILATIGAWVLQKSAMLIMAGVTGVMTAAQWLLNAAMAANPMTLVLIAVVALIAGMVLLYKKSETARNIMNNAWNGIKDGVVKAIDTIKEYWEALKTFFKNPIKGVVDIFKKEKGGVTNVPDIPVVPQLAKGTSNWQGGVVQVHEKGGEIIDLSGGSRVYPHDKSVSMAREQGRNEGGGGSKGAGVLITGNNFNVRQESDIDSIAMALFRKVEMAGLNMP